MRTNWDLLTEERSLPLIHRFAIGDISARAVTKAFTNTDMAGEFRGLLRSGGVDRARELARKALRRRGVLN